MREADKFLEEGNCSLIASNTLNKRFDARDAGSLLQLHHFGCESAMQQSQKNGSKLVAHVGPPSVTVGRAFDEFVRSCPEARSPQSQGQASLKRQRVGEVDL